MKKKLLVLLTVLLASTHLLWAQPASGLLPRQEDEQCRQWVDQTLARMSLQEKVGQLFVYTLDPKMDRKTQKQVKLLAKKYKVGALLYSAGTVDDQAQLTNLAQKSAQVPLMIAFDGEWGLSMRLPDTPLFPKNAALGCIEDNSLIEEYGREVARELREMGVQANFAPDADVNTNPLNPMINVRSFGENPKRVADKVVAYSRGLESGGVLSVAKHFPGHGDTDVDSHIALPRLYYNRDRLDSVELYPFQEAIRAGTGGVMVGHLLVPALEPDRITASSLSRSIVTGLLKEEMGFQGLVFTDALSMQSVAREPNVTVKALKAGNDMILIQQDIDKALRAVLDALASGDLPLGEVDAKCRKILTYKYLLGLNQRPQMAAHGLPGRINTAEAQALAARLRKAAITVLGNYFNVLPLSTEGSVAILSVGEADTDQSFLTQFKQHTPAECFRITKQVTEDERRQVAEKLRKFHRVIISVTAKDLEMRSYQPLIDALDLQMPTVYAFFTSYRALIPLEAALTKSSAVVLAHSAEEDVQRYVADVLFAKAPAQGKLSVRVGNLFRAGEGATIVPGMAGGRQPEDYGMKGYLLHRIDSVVQAGLDAGAYPGCQVLVLKAGKPVYDRCFGTYSDKDKTPVRPTDLYDLASLTKSTGTLLAVMKLCDEGRLKLTDRAASFLPWLQNSNKKNLTIRELLLHESGLLPYIRFYRDAIDDRTVEGPLTQGFVDQWHHTRIGEYTYACSDFKYKAGLFSPRPSATHTLPVAEGMWLTKSFKQAMLQTIARSELGEKRFVYSDLGFIVLQQVVEAITKRPINEYLTATFYEPMGLPRTLFRPLGSDPSRVSSSSSASGSGSPSGGGFPKSEIIPTASNDFLRRQDLCGYVQDEAAAFLGGVSGNAGLFSTAREVGQVYQMLLNGGELDGKRYLSEATCKLFTTVTSATSHRGLGFDKPNRQDPKATACALSTPVEVYGHTGSTGTCAWTDPTNGLVYVFLSNRVCPDGWNGKLNSMKIRQGIQEVIYRSVTK